MPRILTAVLLLVPAAFAQSTHQAGELLLSDHSCTRCHAPDPGVDARLHTKIAPRLSDVGARVTPQYLRRYLLDPHGTKPGTTMPDVLNNVGDDARRTRAVEALVHFLVSHGGGIKQEPVAVSPGTFERGRQLFHQVGCVGCHAPKEKAWELAYPYWELANVSEEEREFHAQEVDPYVEPGTLPPPDVPLPDLAMKTTVQALTRFLVDPLHVRPSGRMPSLALSDADAEAIAHYLLKDQQGEKREPVPGLKYEYFEYPNTSPAPNPEGQAVVRSGVIHDLSKLPEHRDSDFAFRYSGFVDVPEEGSWTFFTRSDDGSRLYLDGKLLVQNDGTHPMVEKSGTAELAAGRHSVEVLMFERGGGEGLEVRWESKECDVPKAIIPRSRLSHESLVYKPVGATEFVVNPRQVKVGEMLFGMVGCASCHSLQDEGMNLKPLEGVPSLASLKGKRGGCIGPENDGKSPKLALTDGERDALAQVLASPSTLSKPRTPAESVDMTMRQQNCYACHRRSGTGGTHPLRKEYFKLLKVVDADDSGRLPPDLSGVGRKLHKEWLAATLLDGKRVHQHMASRMPEFGKANIGHLVDAFHEADPQKSVIAEPEFSVEAAKVGRDLVGTSNGLGCIRCHEFCGEDSLGIPAVDLEPMTRRLRWPWFKDLLLNPNAVNMDTRMPEFWVDGKSPVKDLLGGDPEKQIEAIWTYLSLGATMPVPDGLKGKAGAYDLLPGSEPVMVGVFMKDVSPRTVVVGHKERIHCAFDVQNSRLAKVWRGSFFNAKGTWHARAGALEVPASKDVLDMPKGVPFARLASMESPWPEAVGAEAGYAVVGRRVAAQGVPWFRYRYGDWTVEESFEPLLSRLGGGARRRFVVHAPSPGETLFFRAATGKSMSMEDGEWRVHGDPVQRLRFSGDVKVKSRSAGGGQELLASVSPGKGKTVEFAVEIWW